MISLDRVKTRREELLAKGNSLQGTKYGETTHGGQFVNQPLFLEWRLACCIFLEKVFGSSSLQFSNFTMAAGMSNMLEGVRDFLADFLGS